MWLSWNIKHLSVWYQPAFTLNVSINLTLVGGAANVSWGCGLDSDPATNTKWSCECVCVSSQPPSRWSPLICRCPVATNVLFRQRQEDTSSHHGQRLTALSLLWWSQRAIWFQNELIVNWIFYNFLCFFFFMNIKSTSGTWRMLLCCCKGK